MKKRAKRKAQPENRAEDGHFRPGHSVGKATRFVPGICPNPGGRPKIKLVSEAARKILGCLVPGDKYERTFAEVIVQSLAFQAIDGNIAAASELTDRAEGRAPMAMQLQQGPDPLMELITEMKKISASLPPVENPEDDPDAQPRRKP